MTIKKYSNKWWFYWVLALSFVAWSWTTLYIHSFSNLWGGGHSMAIRAGEERARAIKALAEMEKNNAPAEEIYDQRMSLSLQLAQIKNFVGARKILEDEAEALLKLPDSEENFLRRARVEERIGHIYVDEGLFHEARNCFNRAGDLVRQVKNSYGSESATLFELALTNEIGVLFYMEASSTLDSKLRDKTFASSEKTFLDLLKQITALQADPSKLTDEGRKRLEKMKDHATSNLQLVKQDQAFEVDFHRS